MMDTRLHNFCLFCDHWLQSRTPGYNGKNVHAFYLESELVSGATLVFGVESKYLCHFLTADLLLFNVKLVYVSGCVCDPSQKDIFLPFRSLNG